MEISKTNLFSISFLTLGILLQIISFFITGSSWLSLVSGVAGIVSVVWCAERKLSFYWFAWIQLITYVVLAYQQRLWGEIGENVFYAVTMIFGMFIWFAHKDNEQKVESKQLSRNQFEILKLVCAIGIFGLWYILKQTNDIQPFMDAVTTVPAIIAQFLLIFVYKEQWYFWLIIDIASIYMWAMVGDWNMSTQFIFWTANCIYGIYKWK